MELSVQGNPKKRDILFNEFIGEDVFFLNSAIDKKKQYANMILV